MLLFRPFHSSIRSVQSNLSHGNHIAHCEQPSSPYHQQHRHFYSTTNTHPTTTSVNQNVHNPLPPPLPPRHDRKLRIERDLRPQVNRSPGMAEPDHLVPLDILLQQRGPSNTPPQPATERSKTPATSSVSRRSDSRLSKQRSANAWRPQQPHRAG